MPICLFDIDGTLLKSGGAGKAALESALCEEFGVSLRGDVPYSGRTDRAIFRDLFALHGLLDTPANIQKLIAGYLQRLPTCLASHQGMILPGIVEFLVQLQNLDIATGLLTGNVRQGARAKLQHFGIFDYFPFGGFGDHHLDRDEVARECLAETRKHVKGPIRLDQIWVIGDTPLDVQCARAIGVKVVAVATGWHSRQELESTGPDLVLDDLSDPNPLLNLLK